MAAQPDMPMPNTLGQVVFDEAFPDEPIEFTHDLRLDDRLTIASVADLAGRLQPKSVVFDTAALPLLAPVASPAGVLERPGDVIRDLHNANAWLTLLNVEDDPDYAKLVNGLFDQLRPGVTAKQGKMKIVGGFIFLSSPNSVTPIHYDIEFNFLLQVSGTKVVHLGRYESEAARRHEFDRYWDGALGRIETLPEEVATYTVSAGQALYIPPGTPHWVHNGPDVSLSLTLAYLTPATVRENRIEDFKRAFGSCTCTHGSRAIPTRPTPPRSAQWESGPSGDVSGPR